MKANKKIFYIFFILLLNISSYAISLEELAIYALKNNPDIISAKYLYDSFLLSENGINEIYEPQILLSTSTNLINEKIELVSINNLSSSITYKQTIPGGAILNISGEMIFENINNTVKNPLIQTSNVNFSITQSLQPYWIQGIEKNPVFLDMQLKKNYYYNHLLYVKKNVLFNLVSNYFSALICNNEIRISENNIMVLNKQIETSKQMKINGYLNQSNINQLESTRWDYQENLIKLKYEYLKYIQNIKTICIVDFVDNLELPSQLAIYNDLISEATENIDDPKNETFKLEIELTKTKYILEKQSNAPTIGFSIQPNLYLFFQTNSDSANVFQNSDCLYFTISFSFSPSFLRILKQRERLYEMDIMKMENTHSEYIEQRKIIVRQYQDLLAQYKQSLTYIINLYNNIQLEVTDIETQYHNGELSQFDYECAKLRLENIYISKQNIELSILFYSMLLESNF